MWIVRLNNSAMVVILENGHGVDCAGKRSPIWGDGSQLLEWEFNRDIVSRLSEMLLRSGIPYEVLVPEMSDVPLSERCRRANEIYDRNNGHCFLISIHANAGGGSGIEVYTSRGETNADGIAFEIFNQLDEEFGKEWPMRADWADGDPDKEEDFYILSHTKCPAVLVELFFMDNEKDCRFILSGEGRQRCASAIYKAIRNVL